MQTIINAKSGIIVFFLFIAINASGQNHEDALRLSQSINSGTARFVSMGGAFGALGTDFTSLSYNPAGLGAYRSSEFLFSTSLKNLNTSTLYQNKATSDYRTRFLFDNIGFVSSFKTLKEEEKGLVFINFGLGYNRLNDFYSETSAMGNNPLNSIMDHFKNQASGNDWLNITDNNTNNPFRNTNAPWDAIMAWNTFLIDTLVGINDEYRRALNDGEGVNQDQNISSIGGIGEFVFSLAANFSNTFYLGATIGLQDMYYERTEYYWEETLPENLPLPNGERFESLDYQQTLEVEGTGVNFKLGALYLPIPNLRLALAAHTPTYYSITETYIASITSIFDVGDASSITPLNLYDYKIGTPYKLIGSIAYTFSNAGLLSFDYEYVDYSKMCFGKGGDGYRFTTENKEIEDLYTATFNVKGGGEVWFNHLALRAGYAYYGSPFDSNIDKASTPIQVFSAGFGLRIDKLFIDWAYQRYQYSDKFNLYQISPVAERDLTQNKFLFTVGFKF